MNEVITMEVRSGLARLWHSLVFRGLVAVAFGIFSLVQPGISALVLAFAFGVYAIVDGVLAFRSGAMASRIAQLAVVDCLFVGVAQRSWDRTLRALERTFVAVQGRRIPPGRRRSRSRG